VATKLPRAVEQYLRRSTKSLRLAIEVFNRPFEEGRPEAVLHFTLHAHEMLSKAVLLRRRIKIQDRRDSKTISFGKCLNLLGPAGQKVLDEADVISLTALNNVRDGAQHSTISISEGELFLHAQFSLTIADRVLAKEFGRPLADYLPVRVLPISTDPPRSLDLLVDSQVTQVRRLLEPGRRQTVEARTRIRPLLAMDLAAAGESRQPTPLEVDRAARRLKQGRAWQDVMPNLAAVSLDASGTGQTYSVRLTKSRTAPPVRFAESEDEAENAAILREVDAIARFPFGVKKLAELTGITAPKITALIWYLDLKDDPESHRTVRIDKSSFDRYSHKALATIRAKGAELDLQDVLRLYRNRD
jgi:hypothetical protein